mgnify:CR=1 FL=1
MEAKMKIQEIIIVEGRSDSAKLKSFLECDTIETSGSAIDEKTLEESTQLRYNKIEKKHQDAVIKLASNVPVYRLKCTISKEAVEVAHNIVFNNK